MLEYIKTFSKKGLPCKAHVVRTDTGVRVMAESKDGLSDWPCMYNGRILYDHPEWFPKYMKYDLVPKAFDYIEDGRAILADRTEVISEDDPFPSIWRTIIVRGLFGDIYDLGAWLYNHDIDASHLYGMPGRMFRSSYMRQNRSNPLLWRVVVHTGWDV